MTLALLLATSNAAKAVRLRMLCEGLDVSFRDPVGDPPAVEEDAASHLGNAIAKSIGWSRAVGGVALATDGGLTIPALGNAWESTLTKRATGEGVDDEERARRLLKRMAGLDGNRREAYWTEAVSLSRQGTLICAWEADGTVGSIGMQYLPDPVGPDGFWADGLWEAPSGLKRWQLSESERKSILDPWVELAGPVRDVLSRMR